MIKFGAKAPGVFYSELCPQAKACGNSSAAHFSIEYFKLKMPV